MELIPPSYQSATDRDAWAIIAHYIPSSDLCAASLVCRRWHDLFMPFLWGDPASHFGTENDAVYVALTRFRRTLKYARPEIRALTHTLHLPPALSEIYGGPRPDWLREILEYLPRLQCLMVSKLPFFDHNAMVALRNQSESSEYNIRLLLADSEPNATSSGLAETIVRFPRLTYLDLSYTTPARDHKVLSTLSQLEHLQVLKLRGIGLKDTDAEFLANAIGIRTRFLDVRDNLLTDMAVRSLLQASFLPPDQTTRSSTGSTTTLREWDHSAADHDRQKQFFKSPDLDEQYIKLLSQPGHSYACVDDMPYGGITHLYIAGNPITVEGAAGLLASSRLHALDVGTVNTADAIHKTASKHGIYPGAEKLAPILGKVAGDKLTYLRVHHAVLTAEPPAREKASQNDYLPELPTASEIRSESELDSQEIHELPGDDIPVYELADTSVSASGGSTIKISVSSYEDETLPSVRRGSAFAPECVIHPTDETKFTVLDSPVSDARPIELNDEGALQSISSISVQDQVYDGTSISRSSSPLSADGSRARRIRELLAKRPRGESLPLRPGKESRAPYLHPSHIPHLETLVLTDVPSHISPHSPILYTLTRFITACSNEALLATLQAGSDYSLPPGQARLRAEQQRSRNLFGLRRIILEITPTDRSTRLSSWKPGLQTSSTGDRDSEALWAAAADDFSFFEDMECGIPENDPGKYFPMAVLNEKVSLMPSDDDTSIHSHSGHESPLPSHRISQRSKHSTIHSPSVVSGSVTSGSPPHAVVNEVDLVAELAAFRRAKKAEYEKLVYMQRGRRNTGSSAVMSSGIATTPQLSMAHFVEGHWKGEVKIVRNPTSKMRSGMVDMYGNYFEKGYLYP